MGKIVGEVVNEDCDTIEKKDDIFEEVGLFETITEVVECRVESLGLIEENSNKENGEQIVVLIKDSTQSTQF